MAQPPPSEVRIDAGPPNNAAGTPASAAAAAEGSRSRKPANTKFKQQQLPAWQPMLTARSVLPFLVAIGLAFIPIGIALYLSANNVVEVMAEYTDCVSTTSGSPCANESSIVPNCQCNVNITLDRDMGGPVFMYYAMENFFQNHRKYVKSRDDNQLMGDFKDLNDPKYKEGYPSTECMPFQKNGAGQGVAPCGAIANSLFNDSISLVYNGPSDGTAKNLDVHLLRTDIAWKSDRETKFRNPNTSGKSLQAFMTEYNYVSPQNWQKQLWELDNDTSRDNNGLQNEDLIVWMRTAAFPSFRKLYRRVDHQGDFADRLPKGNYTLKIDYNYPVKVFDGRKYVVLSSVSWIGGRNTFLGIAYMTVGSCCIVLAATFFFIHIKWGKKNQDYENCRMLMEEESAFWPKGVLVEEGQPSEVSVQPNPAHAQGSATSHVTNPSEITLEEKVEEIKRKRSEKEEGAESELTRKVTFEELQEELVEKALSMHMSLSAAVSSGDNILVQGKRNSELPTKEKFDGHDGEGRIDAKEDLEIRESTSDNTIRARRRRANLVHPAAT